MVKGSVILACSAQQQPIHLIKGGKKHFFWREARIIPYLVLLLVGAASQAELQLLLPPFSISLKEEREGGSSDSCWLQRRRWRGGRNRERRELLFLSGIVILSWEGSDFVPILGGLIIFLSSPLLPLPSTLSLNKISFAVEAIPACLPCCLLLQCSP